MKLNIFISTVIVFFLGSAVTWAGWSLDMAKSGLSYGSIKKDSVGESNHFRQMTGHIADNGEISLNIDLMSVETWVDIRNSRMKEFFFQTAKFPRASLKGKVDMAKFSRMKVGDQLAFQTKFDFSLHGVQQSIDADLVILRLSEKTVMIIPNEFIFVNAAKFDLLPGLEKLKKLAKLPAISSSVPVAFHLTFTRVGTY